MTIRAFPDLSGFAPRDCAFYAIDEGTYDGAPDAGLLARAVGCGATPEEAIADLRRLLDELDEANDPEEAEWHARRAYGPHPGDTP